MKLREQFYKEIEEKFEGKHLQILFNSSNQDYITWLENKIEKNSQDLLEKFDHEIIKQYDSNKHSITKIEDISNLINEDNFANFMIDFTDLMIKVVQIKKKTKELNGAYPMGLMKDFTWIDDKKNGVKELHFNGEVLKFDTFEKPKQ